MKYSKIIGLILVGLSINMILLSAYAEATPPRFIDFQYDKNTEIVKVQLFHFSPFRTIHYIYRIEIQKNGSIDQSHLYNKQPNFIINRYQFNLSAETGDEITISAYCVLFGYNTKTKTISSATKTFVIQ